MKNFHVHVRFDTPGAGVVPVEAHNEEDAKAQVNMLLINHRNVEVLSVYQVPVEEANTEETAPAPVEVIN